MNDDLGKLMAKGYPTAMKDFYEQKVAEFQAHIHVAQTGYAAIATRVESAKPELEEVEAATTQVDSIMTTLASHHKSFKGSVVSDLKKLTA